MTTTGTKKDRLSSGETRARTLVAGLDALTASGLDVGLGAVNLERAVEAAGVSRSSAYAAWSGEQDFTPQELFQRTVLKRALAQRMTTIEEMRGSATEVLAKMGPDPDPRLLLKELIRVIGEIAVRSIATSTRWQLAVAVRSVLSSSPNEKREPMLAEWVEEGEERIREETIETFYRPLADLVGLRPRPEFGEKAFHYAELAASSLAEGMGSRYFMKASEYFHDIEITGPDGEQSQWSLFSLVLERIVMMFFEPVDPSLWTIEVEQSSPSTSASM